MTVPNTHFSQTKSGMVKTIPYNTRFNHMKKKNEQNARNEEARKEVKPEAEARVRLTDDDLSFVNAAGGISRGRINAESGPGQAGIGGGAQP